MKMLLREMDCHYCFNSMSCVSCSSAKDGFAWICHKETCVIKRLRISIRKNSIFAQPKLSLSDMFSVIFYFAKNKKVTVAANDIGIKKKINRQIYAFLCLKISNYIENEPLRLGGPVVIRQVDESLFLLQSKGP